MPARVLRLPPLRLTPRQAEVCLLVVAGESPQAISFELGISSHTVNAHVEQAAARILAVHPEFDIRAPRNVIRRYFVLAAARNPFTLHTTDDDRPDDSA